MELVSLFTVSGSSLGLILILEYYRTLYFQPGCINVSTRNSRLYNGKFKDIFIFLKFVFPFRLLLIFLLNLSLWVLFFLLDSFFGTVSSFFGTVSSFFGTVSSFLGFQNFFGLFLIFRLYFLFWTVSFLGLYLLCWTALLFCGTASSYV